jgi:hypothetical protein
MALFFERMRLCAQKVLDTTDIVRDAMLPTLARVLELLDLLQEGIEHLVVVFAGENVRLESHF